MTPFSPKLQSIAFVLMFIFSSMTDAQDFTSIHTLNNIQGLASPLPDLFFTLEHDRRSDEVSIYRNTSGSRDLILKSPDIGHQGFGVLLNRDKSVAVIATTSKISNETVFFIFDKIGNIFEKKLSFFSEYPFEHNDTMPSFSRNGEYMIVRGRVDYRTMVFKVFKLKDINSIFEKRETARKDFSLKFYSKWILPPSILTDNNGALRPLQAISIDDNRIYILLGNSMLRPKSIFTYTFDGSFVSKDEGVDAGSEYCNNFPRKCFYEPEGLASFSDNKLAILFNVGLGLNKKNIVFFIKKSIKG
ncbi:hypothetical protein [Pantoea anthophila]|uniref:hypothetical protein n=1 Tax=Pantoea anthophila TaxID=470931 RepID=UPI00289D935D|nr:hypothetical protein [Pantoea anthophila]